MPKIPDNLVPLIYLLSAGAIAFGLSKGGVNPELIGMLVGAALTRVKISSTPDK
jgi:hypothetical protein